MSNKIFVPNTLSHKQKQSRLCVTVDDKVCISINDSDEFGIVRFIGCINGKGSNAYYYGIELQSTNGKNDGKYSKIEHFRCGSKRGIFVKRFKIHYVEYPNTKAPRISIGDTVKVSGKYKCEGIIKYIGIPTFKRILQKGNWYGIELNKKIGTTNGTLNGIKLFDAKADHGILITCKHINVIQNNRNQNKKTDTDEKKDHGIRVKQIDSGSLLLIRQRSKTRDSITKKHKIHNLTDSFSSNSSKSSKHSKNGSKNDAHISNTSTSISNETENEVESKEKEFDKIWIISEYGYAISFLLSDKHPNINILKEQIINSFGHIEMLENEQIFVKNVDKMCLLVRIIFHKLESYEKAVKWKFCWKNKTIALRKHDFKHWKEQIDVKEIFPIQFVYKKDSDLKSDDIKKYLIEYLNNLENLSQYEWQIEFIDNDKEGNVKCVINFANIKARAKLFNSKFIELNGNKDYRFKLCIDVDSIKK